MRAVSNLRRRRPVMRGFDELGSSVKQHLTEELEHLRAEEGRIQTLLGLSQKPRLTIVDEETSTLVTASERAELEAAAEEDRDAETGGGEADRREAGADAADR